MATLVAFFIQSTDYTSKTYKQDMDTKDPQAVTSQELDDLKYFDSGALRSDYPKRKAPKKVSEVPKKKAKKNLTLELPTMQGSTLKKEPEKVELRGFSCCPDFSDAPEFDPDPFLSSIPKPEKKQTKLKVEKHQCPRCLVDMKFGATKHKDGTKFKYYR